MPSTYTTTNNLNPYLFSAVVAKLSVREAA